MSKPAGYWKSEDELIVRRYHFVEISEKWFAGNIKAQLAKVPDHLACQNVERREIDGGVSVTFTFVEEVLAAKDRKSRPA